jgi:hypothetical protein
MTTLVCTIPEKPDARLEDLARQAKLPKAQLVHKTLEKAARQPRSHCSAFPLVRKLAGSLNGPSDLATNPKYLEGLGG